GRPPDQQRLQRRLAVGRAQPRLGRHWRRRPGQDRPSGTEGAELVVDLSHPITEGMVTYPGIPGPSLGVHLSREESREHYAPGTEFHIGTVTLAGNTGTYVDSPYHRYPDGADLAGVPLDKLADLPGLVVRAGSGRAVTVPRDLDVRGRAVLLHTGWDRHFGT